MQNGASQLVSRRLFLAPVSCCKLKPQYSLKTQPLIAATYSRMGGRLLRKPPIRNASIHVLSRGRDPRGDPGDRCDDGYRDAGDGGGSTRRGPTSGGRPNSGRHANPSR